ncbi:uncharacterized protein LOC132744834 isoform X2 [Ruditapes philippinarum]|nr:uncharacterized protein LOC132744834 isoform X2 [Ruditapes philippinarum]XP_060589606.1 uncharacterized protein LOC132744834 isoform X2 [Ruditapes philippinarum]
MANPSDPETSEDKGSSGDKQKANNKPSANGHKAMDSTDDTDDSELSDNDLKSNYTQAHAGDISDQERPLSVVENDGNKSYHSLSSTDLSIDARACRLPRQHKSKDALSEKEKRDKKSDPADDVIEHTQFVEEKKKKGKADMAGNDNASSSLDIENFIKQLVKPKVTLINFFDAAIVYDKNDYDNVTEFQQKLVNLAKSELNEDLRIELFDSEEFSQSKIMVVEDVLKKCSIVFAYLTSNFTSAELILFIEEAIGISRFGLGTEQGGCQNPWILKPVHTMPRKLRNYKTPVGLLTVNGIDWFDKHSLHTIKNIIEILRTAITQRKQRSMESSTSINYTSMFGETREMPHLGPPFNIPHGSQRFPQVQTHHRNDPHRSHVSQDKMPIPLSSLSPQPMRNYTADIRTDTQPSYFPSFQNTSYANVGQSHLHQYDSNMYLPADNWTHVGFERNTYDQPPPSYNSIMQHEQFRQPFISERQAGRTISTPEFVQQSKDQFTQRAHSYWPPEQLTNYHAATMPQLQTSVHPISGIPQGPVYPPQLDIDFQRQSSNDQYSSMYRHLSQDALPNQSGNIRIPDQHDYTVPSSRVDTLSQISGDLATKTNLSCDDDVEVDNSTMVSSDDDSRTKHFKNEDKYNESEESSSESDCSSDSDSECFGGAKVVEKVVKIYKCKNVQLGEGNTVKEVERQEQPIDNKLKRKQIQENRKSNQPIPTTPERTVSTEHPQNCLSKSEMNISVSEDNMSAEGALSGRSTDNEEHTFSSDRTKCFENTANTSHASFASQGTCVQKTKPVLKLSVKTEDRNLDRSTNFNNVFSPDNNITEDQLFGSGSIPPTVSSTTETAPFCFSQGIQQTRNIRTLLQPLSIDRKTSSKNTFDNNTGVNTEEVD